mgnify:CR=1 FL=1
MRRVRFVLWLRSTAPRHRVVTHGSRGRRGRHHSARPLVKTRRYESPVAPARHNPPDSRPTAPAKVRQVDVGRAWRRPAARQLSRPNPRRCAREATSSGVIRKGRGARERQTRQTREPRLQANDIVRVPPVKTGAAAPPRRAPAALVSGVTGAIVLRGSAAAGHRQAGRASPCTAAAA